MQVFLAGHVVPGCALTHPRDPLAVADVELELASDIVVCQSEVRVVRSLVALALDGHRIRAGLASDASGMC